MQGKKCVRVRHSAADHKVICSEEKDMPLNEKFQFFNLSPILSDHAQPKWAQRFLGARHTMCAKMAPIDQKLIKQRDI